MVCVCQHLHFQKYGSNDTIIAGKCDYFPDRYLLYIPHISLLHLFMCAFINSVHIFFVAFQTGGDKHDIIKRFISILIEIESNQFTSISETRVFTSLILCIYININLHLLSFILLSINPNFHLC